MTTPVGTLQPNRRSVLGLGLAAVATLAIVRSPSASAAPAAATELARLEAGMPGRLGVYAVDTGSGAVVAHRADERFLLCSTLKVLIVAAVVDRSAREPELADHRLVTYRPDDLVPNSPVTSQHVDEGMTVAALCDAAITYSDNTAANLLFGLLGGPAAVTAFARTLGDQITRSDRTETDLNVTSPGDLRDTSTPAQMAADLRDLVLGDRRNPAQRERLAELMKANTTGGSTIRAGVPGGWVVGDKTGSGAQGESNDIAVLWPPNRSPLVLAVYTSPQDPRFATDAAHRVIADATRIAVAALT